MKDINILIKNELRKLIHDLRFFNCIAILVISISLSICLSTNNYLQELNEYNKNVQEYSILKSKNVGPHFIAKGFYPPSKFTLFSQGMKEVIPKTIHISNDKIDLFYKNNNDGYFSNLLGKFDLSFVLITIFPILIIVLSYDVISKEKENEILQLILSFPVSKRKLIISKIFSLVIIVFISLLITFLFVGANIELVLQD